MKSLKKLKASVEASDQHITEASPIFKNYVEFLKEELTFNNLKFEQPSSEEMINEGEEKHINMK